MPEITSRRIPTYQATAPDLKRRNYCTAPPDPKSVPLMLYPDSLRTDSFYPRGCRHLQISTGRSRLPAFLDGPRKFQVYVRRYDGHSDARRGHSDAMRGPMRTAMYVGRAERTHGPYPRATLAHACAAASVQCQPRRETLIFCGVCRCMVGGADFIIARYDK
jgi:hypothetical protein